MKRKLLQHHLQRLIGLSCVNLVEYYESLDSTNKMAMETIKCSISETNPDAGGYLVFVDEQTQGRGRSGNTWISPPGGLYFSLVLEEMFPPAISLVTALSVAKAIEVHTGMQTLIKWPNDVITDQGKLAGILIQTVDRHTIFGIGINTFDDATCETINREATGLKAVNCNLISLDRRIDLMIEIVNSLARSVEELREYGYPHFKPTVESRLAWKDRDVIISLENHETSGTLKGTLDNGMLLLMSDDGESHHISGTLRLK